MSTWTKQKGERMAESKRIKWCRTEPNKWVGYCETHPGYSMVFVLDKPGDWWGVEAQFCKDEAIMYEFDLGMFHANVKAAKAFANDFLQGMLHVSGYYATFGQ
jgi:hypothetical protein